MYTENPQISEYARREYASSINLLAQSGFCGFEKNRDASSLATVLAEVLSAREAYNRLGAVNNFGFSVWNGAHMVNRGGDGINFLINR